MQPTTHIVAATRVDNGQVESVTDHLTAEAALQLRINGIPFTTTLRTPGHDHELARGLLFTEDIVTAAETPMAFVETPDHETGVTACLDIEVEPAKLKAEFANHRAHIASSSCGLCGTRELKDIEVYGTAISLRQTPPLDLQRIPAMLDAVRESQSAFNTTGGCHAAAAFAGDGRMLLTREDIGRHNAVDKVIGALIAEQSLAHATTLLVSGRVSYEIIMKSYRAAFPILLAVSAPSSFAVESANRFGITLVAFCRDTRATVYTHPERIVQLG